MERADDVAAAPGGSTPLRVIPIAAEGAALYAASKKVYPRTIDGRFARWRWAMVFLTQAVFYGLPWIEWGNRQSVLFDLAARRFYLFGWVLYPQDLIYLAGLLVISALSLFLFTAVAGRLWCGFSCPQTVYTEIFLWVEQKIEGNRSARIRLDGDRLSMEKLVKKCFKHLVWIAIAAWTGFTFVGYFTPIRELGLAFLQTRMGSWEVFWVFFYGFATYGNAGFMREQVCKYMCPYARFQSAMFDKDTLVISYDTARGEPRGHRKRGASLRVVTEATRAEAAEPVLGDCIDCLACVQVCPTGIDIRNGLQIECIACAACIDACDAVMDKMHYPRGLIRYTTENALAGQRSRLLRVRTAVYAVLLAAFVGAFVWAVAARAPVIVEVLHDRNTLFRSLRHGAVENGYAVKLVNKTDGELALTIRPDTDLPLRMLGTPSVTLAAGEVFSLPMTLRAEGGQVSGRHPIAVLVTGPDGTVLARGKSHFFAPEHP